MSCQFLDRQILDWVRVRVRVRVAVQELTVQELTCSRRNILPISQVVTHDNNLANATPNY